MKKNAIRLLFFLLISGCYAHKPTFSENNQHELIEDFKNRKNFEVSKPVSSLPEDWNLFLKKENLLLSGHYLFTRKGMFLGEVTLMGKDSNNCGFLLYTVNGFVIQQGCVIFRQESPGHYSYMPLCSLPPIDSVEELQSLDLSLYLCTKKRQ